LIETIVVAGKKKGEEDVNPVTQLLENLMNKCTNYKYHIQCMAEDGIDLRFGNKSMDTTKVRCKVTPSPCKFVIHISPQMKSWAATRCTPPRPSVTMVDMTPL